MAAWHISHAIVVSQTSVVIAFFLVLAMMPKRVVLVHKTICYWSVIIPPSPVIRFLVDITKNS